jgi:hypothetical protein
MKPTSDFAIPARGTNWSPSSPFSCLKRSETYGEVGLAIDLGDAFSLQPSYRLNWTDSEEEGRDGVAAHALKLGANFKF